MKLPENIKQQIDDLRLYLSRSNSLNLKIESNGGNSILMVYPPEFENNYIETFKSEFSELNFIDVSEVFTEFIDFYGLDKFKEFYDAFSPESEKIFSSSNFEENLLNMILAKISESVNNGKIPVLIRTGMLYGTGIANIAIVDSTIVRELQLPLIILYPGKFEGEKLLYLNFQTASKYRSIIIN